MSGSSVLCAPLNRLGVRLAADIGGTFTDVVLETATGRSSCKVLTTAQQPERAVLEGVERLFAESGCTADQLELFVHGTTLATNALIERKGARTALLTTEGFRDILEMGFEKRYEQFDVNIERPPELVPRLLRYTVRERIAADGRVLLPLDEPQLAELALSLTEAGIESLAIGLLNAHANGVHERRAFELLRERLPASVTICLSSEVCPEMREYERLSTTCANAYVRPLMGGYLNRLRHELTSRGFAAPMLLMMSGGGLTTLEQAARFPIRLVESGPAGGAILAAHIAEQCGLDDVMAFDMGGTTAKICLINDRQPERSRRFEIGRVYRNLKGSGLPVRIPVIELVEIGAGGGSIGRVDALSRITVGPDSAGSEPGPASYGHGGTQATVTDANLQLGRLDPDRFAGGHIQLDAARAGTALRESVGARLALDAFWSAAGISEIVEENMANAARVHAIERGKVIGNYTMVAFGGGAPLHAGRLAQKLGIRRIVVPRGAGVGSAIGFLRAPVAYEVVRSDSTRLSACDPETANARLRDMREQARAVVEPAAAGRALDETVFVELRYAGQGHELRVPVQNAIDASELAALRERFERDYERIYGLRMPRSEIDLVTWSLTLSTVSASGSDHSPDAQPTSAMAGNGTPMAGARLEVPARVQGDAAGGSHITTLPPVDVWEPALGRPVSFARYLRSDIPTSTTLEGPALIVEDETTTVVPAGWRVTHGPAGHLILESGDTRTEDQKAAQAAEPAQVAGPARAAGLTQATSPAGARPPAALRAIQTQVMWNRLVSVVEEQAQALLRTAFGSVAREAGDLSAGVYDVRGRMLAQAVTGTPGHVNTMAVAVRHFFEVFAPLSMRAGDVYVTNDPWLGTGHLFDFVVVTPVFRRGLLVALVASTCHTIDVGGIGFSADAKSVFEEGVCIPHSKLRREGLLNDELLAIIEANSRNPVEARGDILSLVSCNDVGAQRLVEMMDEYALEDLDALAAHILEHSRRATCEAIARLPSGRYEAAMSIDGYEERVDLKAVMTVDGERLSVDFAGSSPASRFGINSPQCYSDAYSVFGLKCLIAPDVPNNAGSLEPFEIRAEAGSVVAPRRPSPVTARHVVGQMLPDLMFGCLEAALGGQVPGESAGSIWVLSMAGGPSAPTSASSSQLASTAPQAAERRAFNVMSVGLGGMGARPSKDGLATTAFPSGVGAIALEVTESQAPVVFWHKEFLADSGGPGQYRGGLAQRIVIGGLDGRPFTCNAATFDRRNFPARGRNGGEDGARGRVLVESADGRQTLFEGKGTIEVPANGRLIVELPGGGGFGVARLRHRESVRRDLSDGLISASHARTTYGLEPE